MTTYYTYRDDVPLRPGQTLGFTAGRGYYAKGVPTPVNTATNFDSEHGQGGGSGSRDTGRKPTAAGTTTGYPTPAAQQPTPAVVSEHGQGGGSGSDDSGREPTAQETTAGYATPAPRQPTPVVAPALVSEHGKGGGSSSTDTGSRPTGQEATRGYANPAARRPPPSRAVLAEVPGPAKSSGVNRSLAAATSTGLIPTPSLTALVSDVARAASRVSSKLLHDGGQAAHLAAGIARNASALIERAAEVAAKTELQGLELEWKYGKAVANLVDENAATVAWVTAGLAIVTPFPLDVAFGALSVAASARAGVDALKKREYAEALVDFAAAAAGVGGLSARLTERLADLQHAATATRIEALTEQVATAKAPELPRLTVDEQRSLTKLVNDLQSAGGRAAQARAAQRERDFKTAMVAFLGDPRVDPGLAGHGR